MTPEKWLKWRGLATGPIAYLVSTFPVLLGVLFGLDFVVLGGRATLRPEFLRACSRFDGEHYKEIVKKGYSYDEGRRSAVAFFPGYPLLARAVVALTGWSPALALLVVSNVMLVAAFLAMAAFLQVRWPEAAPSDRFIVLALLGLFPSTFFYRMTYSESTFLFGLAMFLNGAARRWPLLPMAFVAGALTAIRPVGVTCTGAFLWYVLTDPTRGSISRRMLLALICLPLACWGLLAYMGFQEAEFGNPLAFAQNQQHWSYHAPRHAKFWDKAEALATAEPLTSVYDSDSKRHWGQISPDTNPLFSLYFWNPILFVGAFALVILGSALLWLTGLETILGMGLLAIPYLTRSYEMSMASHARFASVVIPAYLVAGRLMRQIPQWAIWAVFAAFAAMLCVWSALFAAGYAFF